MLIKSNKKHKRVFSALIGSSRIFSYSHASTVQPARYTSGQSNSMHITKTVLERYIPSAPLKLRPYGAIQMCILLLLLLLKHDILLLTLLAITEP